MTGLESSMLSYLLNSLWQIPLLFLFGWLAARLLGNFAPALQHRVWVTVMLLQIFVPLLSALSHNWLNLLLAVVGQRSEFGAGQVFVSVGPASAPGASHLPAPLLIGIALAYLGSLTYFAAKFIWNCVFLSGLRRTSFSFAPGKGPAILANDFEVRLALHGVTIATSTSIFGPVTIGALNKLVLLPPSMTAACHQQDLPAILAHELAHIERNDFLKNLLYELVTLPVKYHPVFWLTRERMIETREIVCDALAAQVTGRKEYARSLLRLAAVFLEGKTLTTPYAIGVFDANALERRLMNLTRKQTQRTALNRLTPLVFCIGLGLITCGTALAGSMQVDTSQTETSDSNTPRLAAGVAAGNKLTGNVPKYPESAKKAKIGGKVLLKAIIGKDGKMQALNLISGPPELQQSAWDAVRTWTYRPYLLNGNRVDVETTITVTYTLAE
jgi:TonB family protein